MLAFWACMCCCPYALVQCKQRPLSNALAIQCKCQVPEHGYLAVLSKTPHNCRRYAEAQGLPYLALRRHVGWRVGCSQMWLQPHFNSHASDPSGLSFPHLNPAPGESRGITVVVKGNMARERGNVLPLNIGGPSAPLPSTQCKSTREIEYWKDAGRARLVANRRSQPSSRGRRSLSALHAASQAQLTVAAFARCTGFAAAEHSLQCAVV